MRFGGVDVGNLDAQAKQNERATADVSTDNNGILDTVDIPIVVVGPDCRIAHFNRAASEVIGFTASDIGRLPDKALKANHVKEVEELCSQAIADSAPYRRDIRMGDRWFVLRVAPYLKSDGQPAGAVLTFTNVTAFRESIGQAIYEREHTKGILNTVVEPLVVLDSKLRVQTANRAFYAMFGVSRDQTHGVPLCNLGDDPWKTSQLWSSLKAILSDNSEFNAVEVECTFPNGPRTLSLNARRLPKNGDAPNMILLGMQDITERKRNEKALRDSEQRNVADLEAMTLLYELGNQCVDTSRDFEHCLGAILEAAIGMTGAEKGNIQLLDPESSALTIVAQRGFEESFLKFFERVRGEDGSACGAPAHSGKRVLIEDVTHSDIFAGQPSRKVLLDAGVRAVQSTPLLSSAGTLLGMISTHFSQPHRIEDREVRLMDLLARQAADYLERKRAEDKLQRLLVNEQKLRSEAEYANRMKDEFLATVSHELRTPLNAIIGWSSLIQSGKLGEPEIERALATIDRNAKTQAQLIEDILDVSRAITGKLRIDKQPVNVASIIAVSIDSIKAAAEAKDIQIEVTLDTSVPAISGDANRLQQVVWNLLSNAVKFTPAGGKVEVRLEQTSSSVQIVVGDTGQGIDRDFLPFIFDRFRQADGTITRRQGGLGLGLAIVRHLVELHGGGVSAQSAGKGRGSTFIVSLPVLSSVRKVAKSKQPRKKVKASLSKKAKLQVAARLDGLRVLLVDDDSDSLEVLQAVLSRYGANVELADSAVKALEILRGLKPDILISDLAMSGEDGYSLIQKIRTLEVGNGERIPAVALTAHVRIEDRTRALSAGFNMFVPKPVEPDELISAIANLLDRQPAEA